MRFVVIDDSLFICTSIEHNRQVEDSGGIVTQVTVDTSMTLFGKELSLVEDKLHGRGVTQRSPEAKDIIISSSRYDNYCLTLNNSYLTSIERIPWYEKCVAYYTEWTSEYSEYSLPKDLNTDNVNIEIWASNK